ncbi:MAG: hypothetical protein JNM21_01170 [Taibaiella sp.]|nr:hypothetical protein [Taibaiella sp.]
MLQKSDFFALESMTHDEAGIEALLHINPAHPIFAGHFPGQPVVPGVCMLQLMKEVAETALSRSLLMKQVAQVKFLQVLVPAYRQNIALRIEWKAELAFNASLIEGAQTIMKMSGTFE